MVKTTKKTVLSWISFGLSAAIFLFALVVFIMTITARARNDRVELFGYSFAIVVTDSMEPEIMVGDLIIVKSCNITEIEVGQNAVFIGLSGEFEGKSIVHQVVEIHDVIDDTGEKTGICLETWGVNNYDHDIDYVYSDNLIGREVFHSTVLGAVMTFLREPINWMYLLVILLTISFAGKQVVKIIKLIKNKEKENKETGTETDLEKDISTETNLETEIETAAITEIEEKTETEETEKIE